MAHIEQREFLHGLAVAHPGYFTGVRVLEVGSLNINGTVRDFFTGCDYTGVDVGPGPGVDVVGYGQRLDYDDESFDTVISAECFEHNPDWLATFVNMRRMCSGLVIVTCATAGRLEHGTATSDRGSSPLTADWGYYRNLVADDFYRALPIDDLFTAHSFTTNTASHDLYFWGMV